MQVRMVHVMQCTPDCGYCIWWRSHLFHIIMPYYRLFSCDLHILDFQWRSSLCSLRFVEITLVCSTFMTSQRVTLLLRTPCCGITMSNDITMDIHCDVTIYNDIAMCTYHGITMHNDVAMNLFCYVLLCQIMILLFRQ